MKKGLLVLLVWVAMLAMVGCGKEPKEQAMLTGSFTAQVRGVLPDYVIYEEEPNMAIVTAFEEFPFIIYVGTERASQMVVGETYVFTFEPTPVDFTQEELETMSLQYVYQKTGGLVITDYRIANLNEKWTGSLRPTIEYVENE